MKLKVVSFLKDSWKDGDLFPWLPLAGLLGIVLAVVVLVLIT